MLSLAFTDDDSIPANSKESEVQGIDNKHYERRSPKIGSAERGLKISPSP